MLHNNCTYSVKLLFDLKIKQLHFSSEDSFFHIAVDSGQLDVVVVTDNWLLLLLMVD